MLLLRNVNCVSVVQFFFFFFNVFFVIKKVTDFMAAENAKKLLKLTKKKKKIFMLSLLIHIVWRQAFGVRYPMFSTVLSSRHHLLHKRVL